MPTTPRPPNPGDSSREGDARASTRPRPRLFRALGRREPPPTVVVDEVEFALHELVKHDSWAATAIYRTRQAADGRRIICKFGRQEPILGVPMAWLGRALASRERGFLEELADLPGVPRACGPVRPGTGAEVLDYALAREYVRGHPLRRRERVDDRFFERMRASLDGMHGRGIAYVDLDKRENIIVDEHGKPWLVDFQICWRSPAGFWGRRWPLRAVFDFLRRGDDYHLLKHRIALRPDQVPPAERELRRRRPWFIRWHRALLSHPFRWLRRRILVWTSVRSGKGSPRSEVFPEESVRIARAQRAERERSR